MSASRGITARAVRARWWVYLLAWVFFGMAAAVAVVVFQVAGLSRGFAPTRYDNALDLAWWAERTRGAQVLEIEIVPRQREFITWLDPAAMPRDETMRLRLPKSGIPEPGTRLMEHMEGQWKGRIERFGWPWHWATTVAVRRGAASGWAVVEGIQIGGHPANIATPRMMPTSPEWGRLLASVAVLGAPLGVGMVCFAAVRARLRARTGRCAACGYSMSGLSTGAPCPECGRSPERAARGESLRHGGPAARTPLSGAEP